MKPRTLRRLGQPTANLYPVAPRRMMRVDDLLAAPYNPRAISPQAARGLRASLRKFGIVQDIVFNEFTGRVVAGHQRLAIIKKDGIQEVEVAIVNLPPAEEKTLNLALNNPKIQGHFTLAVHDLVSELDAALDGALLDELRLTDLLRPESDEEEQVVEVPLPAAPPQAWMLVAGPPEVMEALYDVISRERFEGIRLEVTWPTDERHHGS